jgi:RNA polymerase sigma-70 factor (ECF subfamily)
MSGPAAVRLSFDDIYDQHFTFVWQNLRRLGVRPESIDDAVQDVFIVIHRHLADQDRYTSIKAWLCGISVRIASEYRRRRSRKEGRLEPLTIDVHDDQRPTPFDDAAQSQAARLFESIVSQLNEDHRTVFILAEVEQMTARAIGEALGVNMHTVNSRLRVARQKFEELVAAHAAAAGGGGR